MKIAKKFFIDNTGCLGPLLLMLVVMVGIFLPLEYMKVYGLIGWILLIALIIGDKSNEACIKQEGIEGDKIVQSIKQQKLEKEMKLLDYQLDKAIKEGKLAIKAPRISLSKVLKSLEGSYAFLKLKDITTLEIKASGTTVSEIKIDLQHL